MSILDGLLQDSLIVQPFADRTYLSTNVKQVFDSTYTPNSALLALPLDGGVKVYNPVKINNIPKSGVSVDGVNSFLYNRMVRQIVAIRQDGFPIDVGTVENTLSVTQSLWNGFNDIIEVTNIAYSYPSSDTVLNLPVVAEEFKPYEERPFKVTIDIAGNPHFDVEITITFSNSATYVFSVRGDRLPVKEFTFLSQANWIGNVRMESAYTTSMYKASETSETRQALRVRPARRLSYEFVAVGRDFVTVLWGFMQGLAKRRTYLPMFQDGSVVTQDSLGTLIYCDTINKRFYPGGVLVLALRRYDRSHKEGTSNDDAMYYTAVIYTVTDTTVSLITPPVATVVKGSMVYPGIYSEIAIKDNTFEVFKSTGAIATIDIKEVWGPTTIKADNESYSPTLFYGDAFFTFEWNWNVRPNVGVKRDSIVIRKGRYPTIIPRTGFSTTSIEATVSVHSRAEWWELTGFLNYIKGRYRPFWIKHPLDAYRLGTYTLYNGADLTEVEVLTQGGINNAYSIQAVWIKDSNDVETIVKVDAIRAGFTPNSVILELDPTIIADVAEIKRAFLVRNVSDKIVENWYTDDGVVDVKMSMVELPGGYIT